MANLLLVAAIDIAGLAVAFPIGIGLALVVGVLLNYFISPQGSPLLLFGGVLLVVLAIVVDALAYRRRETTRKTLSARGIQISLACGVLMGVFYPLVAKAITGDHSLGPYSVAFFFALGTAACAVPVNYFLMRKPLTGGQPVSMADYCKGRGAWHWWGVVGGMIWCTGAVLNFVASHAHIIGPAVSYAIGQGATMISAIWGVFVWKEFASAPPGRAQADTRHVPFLSRRVGSGRGGAHVSAVIAHDHDDSPAVTAANASTKPGIYMAKRIVVVGSINLDLVAATQRIPIAGETVAGLSFRTFPGGKGANQAVAAAALVVR